MAPTSALFLFLATSAITQRFPGKPRACSLGVLSRCPTLPLLHQILSVLQSRCMCYLPQAAFPASLYSPLPPEISGTSHLQLWGRAFLSNQLSLNCLAQLSNLELEAAIHTSVSFPKFKYVMIEFFFDYSSLVYTMQNIGREITEKHKIKWCFQSWFSF